MSCIERNTLFWSNNEWEYLKEFTSKVRRFLDIVAPIPQRMVANRDFGLKESATGTFYYTSRSLEKKKYVFF
jgi:hypothetical protein